VAGPFDKDFGYLIPFLDRIAQAADSLSNPAAGRELKELVSGEKARWIRIRELLNSPMKTAGPTGAAAPARPSAEAAATANAPPERPAQPQFTVGRLKGLGRS
jgi:hypothetical protein